MTEKSGSGSSTGIKPTLKCHIVLIPLEELRLHEEIVASHTKDIKASLKRLNYFFRPILVTKRLTSDKKRVVLDGHHRIAALIEIGAKKVPCVEIEYLHNDEINLRTWHPVYTGNQPLGNIKKQLEKSTLTFEQIDNLDLNYLSDKETGFLLCTDEQYFLLKGPQKRIFYKIQEIFNPKNFHYVGEINDAIHRLKNKEVGFVLLRSSVTKQDVIDHALSGDLFAPKTTRHILKFRYQDTRVPLDALY